MKLLDVPRIKQNLGANCGPAALSMILQHYKIPATQDSVRKRLKKLYGYITTEDSGTQRENIVGLARSYGLVAHARKNMTIDNLISALDRDLPLIANIKSTLYSGEGHYVVITGYDDNKLFCNDSSDLRRRHFSFEQFKYLWRLPKSWYRFGSEYEEPVGVKNYAITFRK